MPSQKPMLMLTPFSQQVYVATKWKVLNDEKGLYESIEKYDVHEQFEHIAKKLGWKPPKEETDA